MKTGLDQLAVATRSYIMQVALQDINSIEDKYLDIDCDRDSGYCASHDIKSQTWNR